MTRGDALRLVARPVLLVAWSFLGWGHLVLAATLVNAARGGLAAAWGRLLPAHGASPWGWLNAASAILAVAFWAVIATAWPWMRQQLLQKQR